MIKALNPCLTDWTGQVVWLVGASSGIGLALAEALHQRGAKVIVSARRATALEQFVATHPGSVALAVDVADPTAVHAAWSQLHRHHGLPHMVAFCAGVYEPQRATEFNALSMRQHMEINYGGALTVLAEVIPAMLAARQGHISLVGSVAGYRGLPKALAYGPSKAALINLAEVLYMDLHDHGLGVSIVNPGFVETPLTAHNGFHMPALMSPHDAALAMLHGWAKGRFEIHFPKRFTWALKMLGLLSDRWYFAAVRRATGL